MPTLYIVHLDRHHLGDDLFLKSLAQQLAKGQSGEPACLFVHGSGEKVERTLEAQGYFPERSEGVLEVETDEQRRLVERSVREMNQEIVATLTDEVVSTVGIQGVDRGLLAQDSDGQVTVTNTGWIEALLKQRVVPVVSALVETDGVVQEVWDADVVSAFVAAVGESFDPVPCVLTTGDVAGVPGPDGPQNEATAEAAASVVADADALHRIAEAADRVLVTNLTGLLSGEEPTGTFVTAD